MHLITRSAGALWAAGTAAKAVAAATAPVAPPSQCTALLRRIAALLPKEEPRIPCCPLWGRILRSAEQPCGLSARNSRAIVHMHGQLLTEGRVLPARDSTRPGRGFY